MSRLWQALVDIRQRPWAEVFFLVAWLLLMLSAIRSGGHPDW